MNYFKVSLIVVSLLMVSRLIPIHQTHKSSCFKLLFTSSIWKKIYSCVAFGFLITDLIGMHNLTFFTWGSIFLIGMLSKYFKRNFIRIIGAVGAAFLFYIITNFGVC